MRATEVVAAAAAAESREIPRLRNEQNVGARSSMPPSHPPSPLIHPTVAVETRVYEGKGLR